MILLISHNMKKHKETRMHLLLTMYCKFLPISSYFYAANKTAIATLCLSRFIYEVIIMEIIRSIIKI